MAECNKVVGERYTVSKNPGRNSGRKEASAHRSVLDVRARDTDRRGHCPCLGLELDFLQTPNARHVNYHNHHQRVPAVTLALYFILPAPFTHSFRQESRSVSPRGWIGIARESEIEETEGLSSQSASQELRLQCRFFSHTRPGFAVSI